MITGFDKALAAILGGCVGIVARFVDIPPDILPMIDMAITGVTAFAVWLVPNKPV